MTSALDGGEWSASRPDRFTPRKRASGTHWIGGWECLTKYHAIKKYHLLNQAPSHEDVLGSEIIVPSILNLGIRYR
jgi:hypothetical protein